MRILPPRIVEPSSEGAAPHPRRRRRGVCPTGRLLCAALLWVMGCGWRAPDNILLISLDTTRADHLSCYGYRAGTTPHLDALAARGAMFTRAYAHVPSTLPSHTTILTGLMPFQHNVRCNGLFEVPSSVPLLPEILQRRGSETGAVIGGFPLDSRFKLARGFTTYDDDFSASAPTGLKQDGCRDRPGVWYDNRYLDFERGADEVTDRALKWLAGRKHWFLFVHYFDAHAPYEPIAQYRRRFDDPYDGEIAFVDEQVGRLVKAVDSLRSRTLIMVTADHGEGLGDHGEPQHSGYLYDTTVRVPLIIVYDGAIRAGLRFDSLVAHTDLFPTILDALGVHSPVQTSGRSLMPLLRGRSFVARKTVCLETLVPELERHEARVAHGLVAGRYKLISTTETAGGRTRHELYDLEADPAETHDVSSTFPGMVADLVERLRYEERVGGAPVVRATPHRLDERSFERLRALGYLTGPAPAPSPVSPSSRAAEGVDATRAESQAP